MTSDLTALSTRELTPDDVTLVADWFHGTRLAVPKDVEGVWSRILGDPKIVCRIGVQAATGTPVGFFRLDLAPDRSAEVTLVVSRVWRRRGYGAAMIQSVLGLARQFGVHRLTAMVEDGNLAGRDFFLAAGFEAVGRQTGEFERFDRIVHTAASAQPLEIEVAP